LNLNVSRWRVASRFFKLRQGELLAFGLNLN
jgi:hypothetical protein